MIEKTILEIHLQGEKIDLDRITKELKENNQGGLSTLKYGDHMRSFEVDTELHLIFPFFEYLIEDYPEVDITLKYLCPDDEWWCAGYLQRINNTISHKVFSKDNFDSFKWGIG